MKHALQFKALKYKIFWTQIALALVVGGVGWLYQGLYSSLSLCLGSLLTIIPSFVFASFYPLQTTKMQAKSILKRLYWAEAVKLLVTVLLFILIFQWQDLKVPQLFISFIITQFVSIIVSSCTS